MGELIIHPTGPQTPLPWRKVAADGYRFLGFPIKRRSQCKKDTRLKLLLKKSTFDENHGNKDHERTHIKPSIKNKAPGSSTQKGTRVSGLSRRPCYPPPLCLLVCCVCLCAELACVLCLLACFCFSWLPTRWVRRAALRQSTPVGAFASGIAGY